MAPYKRLERLLRNAFGPSNSDVRMKRFEIRFETRMKDRILNVPMQCKEVRVSFPHTCPHYRRSAARVEDTDAAKRQKKRRHPHLAQRLMQPILRRRYHVPEKAQR